MSKAMNRSFSEQAVNKNLSLGTLLELLRLASKPDCSAVRYACPRPVNFGLFIEPVKPSKTIYDPIPTGNLTLNELISETVPVVAKIAGWYEETRKAEQEAREAHDRVSFLMSKFRSYGIDPDYTYVPEKYYVKDSNGQFVEADPQP